jgi:hypothetical protein
MDSAVVGQIFLHQENWRRVIWDFFNSIDPSETLTAEFTVAHKKAPRT